jgi:hypothetical protein
LRAVSVFGVPHEENSTVGGSKVTFWNWLKGARLWTPARLRVEIQPIGRGTQQELNGLWGSPEVSVRGS